MTANIKWICDLSNFMSIIVVSFDMWNVGDFTWSSWISMDSQVKKGNKKIFCQCRLTSFAKRALGLIFHVVVLQSSLMARAKLSFLVVNPTRYCFTFSLPSSTLFCLKSLVTFRKCRVALLMATLHSCKLSWCWTLLRNEWLCIYQHLSCLFEASRQT